MRIAPASAAFALLVGACAPEAVPCDGGCPLGTACTDGACVASGALAQAPTPPIRRVPEAHAVALTGVADSERAPAKPTATTSLFSSCLEIAIADATAASGTYTISDRAGHPRTVECDMDNDGGGFTVVIRVQWSADDALSCPDGWIWTTLGCARGASTADAIFPVPLAHYADVRGEARAFSSGSDRAFAGSDALLLDDNYVDGVSVTTGAPRVHIWTFAAGLPDLTLALGDSAADAACPCAGGALPYDFVHQDFSCDSPVFAGVDTAFPLWDGESGCGDAPESADAFERTDLGAPADRGDALEARIMSNGAGENGLVYVTRLVLAAR